MNVVRYLDNSRRRDEDNLVLDEVGESCGEGARNGTTL